MRACDRLQHFSVVELPEDDLLGGDQLGDASRQAAVEVGESMAGPRVSRHGQQGVNRGLVRPLDALGALRPLFVDQPLPFAAVEVRPQVDQRVDHGLTALAQLRDRDGCRNLVREDRERLLLDRRIAAWARDTDHAERAAGDL